LAVWEIMGMKNHLVGLCVTACVLTGAPAVTQAPAEQRFLPGLLVLAKAVVADPGETGRYDVAFEVLRVYCGAGLVPGSRFVGTFSDDRLQLNSDPSTYMDPPVKRGEVGIWWVEGGTGPHTPMLMWSGRDGGRSAGWRTVAFPVPARKILATTLIAFTEAEEWATEVERLAKATQRQRLRLWMNGAQSSNRHIATWSLKMLEENCSKSDLIERCYDLLGAGRLSIAAEVAVEDLLCRHDARRWLASELRMKLLEHWISGALTDELLACLVANRFHDALAQRQLAWKAWLPLMKRWIVTDCMDLAVEMRVFACYEPSLPDSRAIRDEIVAFALGLLKEATDVEEKVFAAKWLTRLPPVSDKELATVKALQQQSGDARVRDLLAKALEDGAKRKGGGASVVPGPP
jgi:hypothetical protein